MTITSWDRRELCPDGACVGVIGEDGRCKVCGTVAPNWGEAWRRGEYSEASDGGDEDDHAAKPTSAERAAEAEVAGVAVEAAAEDWSARALCSDGACIGVIAADGRCSVCGKPPAP